MQKLFYAACVLPLLLAGCTSYYKVTDLTTGKSYYTTELQQNGNGSATFKDGKTGNTVNLQHSEIATLSQEAYESGRHAAAAPPPKADPNPFK